MFASPGALRATGRKAANTVRSNHHPTNGHGSGGTNSSRALHVSAPLSMTAHVQPITLGKTVIQHSLEQIRPRTPANLFSATRNFVTTFFTRLSAPGVRVPANIPHTYSNVGSRSMHTRLARSSIQSGLSLPARHAMHSKTFGAGTFLPRAPTSPRPPVATQMGLGTARNFSSTRPIFQNLVDNVPIALRSLYEADLDLDFARKKTGLRRPLYGAVNTPKVVRTGQKMKPKASKISKPAAANKENDGKVAVNSAAELEHYFRAPTPPAVTTYIFIPLAPTPTNRLPLASRDALPSSTGHFIPLQRVGEIHASHGRHALRVSTLFSRLDQANVWAHAGVSCSPYSGHPRKITFTAGANDGDDGSERLEGVCTFLKVEFVGWTLAEVRGVTGEIGQSWCLFEEVWHDDAGASAKGMLSEAEDEDDSSFFSPPSTVASELDVGMRSPVIDPAQSFVMPTLDFSSSFGQSAFAAVEGSSVPEPKTFECDDPWVTGDTDYDGDSSMPTSPTSLSRSSSYSSFSAGSGGLGLIIDPPSENGWFEIRSRSGSLPHTRFDDGPQDIIF